MTQTDANPPAIVVVIPAYNAAETIGLQLSALARQEYAGPWHVVVVDDGSTDGTAALVETLRPTFPVDLTVVRQPKRGVSTARNAGIAATEEELILFCDADDEVASGWLTALTASLAGADGVGGRIELTRLNSPEMLSWDWFAREYKENWLTESVWRMPSPIGACCAVTREAWAMIGGFNPVLRYGEETEFYWRLQAHGRTLAYSADALVHYRFPPTPRRLLRKQYDAGRAHTMLLRAYRHPKWRRQLVLDLLASAQRLAGVRSKQRRPDALSGLFWSAGRLMGITIRMRGLALGPDVHPMAGG